MKRAVIVLAMAGLVSLPTVAARAGGGFCHNESPTSRTGTSVVYQSLCPTPTVLHISVGQTVTWKNLDEFDHTVTSGLGGWASETLAPQRTFSHRFDAAGTYTYYCMLHPNMGGTIEVGDGALPLATTPVSSRTSSNAWRIALAGALGLVLGGAGGFGVRRKNGSSGQQP